MMTGNKLTLYTLQNCLICNELKGRLKTLNIQFKDIIIDDGSIRNNNLGNSLELLWKTKTYPILKYSSDISKPLLYFISKTDLEEREGIYIFQDIEDLINKLKQIYEI